MYNNTDYDGSNGDTAEAGKLSHYLTNVWQVAGTEADAGHISNTSFKTPSSENVNMNFLVMLTSDEWVEKLTAAYKDYYGKDYVKEDKYENIGYKWIAEFLTNGQAHSSDGTACKDTAKGNGGSMALVNLNKNKDLKEEGAGKEAKANLTYPAMEEGDNLKGFGGFCYKMYAQVAETAQYPYAACAIINYILSSEGFGAAWGAKDGYYSANSTAAIAETDRELSWWKTRLVIEDPAYVAQNYRDVFQFVQQYEG
jgi:iron(III) transport system substrate-binding protein